jgi:hypothetical protein
MAVDLNNPCDGQVSDDSISVITFLALAAAAILPTTDNNIDDTFPCVLHTLISSTEVATITLSIVHHLGMPPQRVRPRQRSN